MASESTPPLPTGGQGLSGLSGALSGAELIGCLERLGCTGTLLVGPPAAPRVLLLVEGQVRHSVELSAGFDLKERSQSFFFQPHPATALPELQSRHPDGKLAEFRALPRLGSSFRLDAGVIELRGLLQRLAEEDFHGCLALESPDARGLVLVQDGRIATAVYESPLHRKRGPDALRAFLQESSSAKEAVLELLPLPKVLMAGLLGLAFDQRVDHSPAAFSGLEVGEDGYTYHHEGQVYARVPVAPVGVSGRYGPCQSFPALELPSEVPGWESQRYRLTLRGRDALNPMTELSMQFRSTYGRAGKQVLEALTRAASVEEAAHRLGLELAEVKPWLERLEGEGMIREADADPFPPG